jgi:hypothetical protein
MDSISDSVEEIDPKNEEYKPPNSSVKEIQKSFRVKSPNLNGGEIL